MVYQRKQLYFILLWRVEICKLALVWRWFGNPEYWIFYLWPLDLVKSNIPVLHSLSSERWQNFNKIPWVYSKKNSLKHLKKVILAAILLILRIWMVLNSSVASMTSTNMIISLASTTSTASLASKNDKTACTLHTEWFRGMKNLSGLNDLNSLNNLSGLNDLFSLIST